MPTSVGVVGMGYVGLTLTAALARKGFVVHGVDVQPTVIESLPQRPAAHLRARRRGGLRASTSASRIFVGRRAADVAVSTSP